MLTFIRAQAASLTASCIDFLTTILLVSVFHCWYMVGTVLGTIAGGIAYFSLGRSWIFDAKEKKLMPQVVRYLMVWIGYLLLNASFVFLITHYAGVNYIVSKVSVSILLGISYNYLLQKKFVFK